MSIRHCCTYYFRSKEKLYDAVLQDIMRTIVGAVQKELPAEDREMDLRALLRQIVSVYITTLQKHPEFPRFIIRELADGGTRLPGLVDAAIESFGPIPQRIHSLLVTEMKRGAIRPVNPVHFLLNLVGMCVFTFIARPILSLANERAHFGIVFDDAFFRERIDAIVGMACDGLFKGNS